jgi:hypothetical protein
LIDKPTAMNKSKNDPQWLTIPASVNPDTAILHKDVAMLDHAQKYTASLHVERIDRDGRIIVSAHYSSNPNPGSVTRHSFYLTQDQLDAFTRDGSRCVLQAPD